MKGYKTSRRGNALIVHDVEIFAECERGDRVFDVDWLSKAVASAKVDEAGGYLPPLHVRHHDDGEEVEHAGHFRVTGTKRITFQGKPAIAVIADLIITSAKVQEQFEAGALPYRSVEIFGFDNPRFDTLALLDHEPPFLRLPLLAPEGRSVASATFRTERLVSGEGVLSFVSSGKAARVLFRAEGTSGETMGTKTKGQNPEAADPKTAVDVAATAAETGGEESRPDGSEGAKFEEDGKDKDDGDDMDGGADPTDVKTIVAKIKDGSISVADMQAIMEAIDEMTGGAPQEPEDPAPAAAPGAETMKDKNSNESVKFAKLRGELDALKAREAARDEAEKCSADVRSAMQRLTGRALPDNAESLFRDFRSKHGAQAFADYVEGFESSVGYALDESGETARFMSQQPRGASETVLKFQDRGPGAIEKAIRLEREWYALRATGLKTSLENYIKLNLDRETAK